MNFSTDAEKERHIQFQMAHALSDTDLIRKLLAMKIEATTAEMPAVCRTHIAIADNVFNAHILQLQIMSLMSLK